MTLSYPYQPKFKRACLVDGLHGFHLPQAFALKYGDLWGLDPEDLKTLSEGISGENSSLDSFGESYWSTWESVLDYARFIDSDGVIYRLEQDCDLFMVIEDSE